MTERYKCLDCGNTDTFFATRRYRKEGIESITINSDGSVDEVIDDDEESYDTDDFEDITCSDCNSVHIRWVLLDDEEQTPPITKKTLKNVLKLTGRNR